MNEYEYERERLARLIAVEMSSPRLSASQAIWPYGDQARRVADAILTGRIEPNPPGDRRGPFCNDCPDREACSSGLPCGGVRAVAAARVKP